MDPNEKIILSVRELAELMKDSWKAGSAEYPVNQKSVMRKYIEKRIERVIKDKPPSL